MRFRRSLLPLCALLILSGLALTEGPQDDAKAKAVLDASYDLQPLHNSVWGVGGAFVYSQLDRPTYGALTSETDPEQAIQQSAS